MFKCKKKSQPDKCDAMRCVNPPLQDNLCQHHYSEWAEAGSPPLETNAGTAIVAAPGTAIVPADLGTEMQAQRLNANQSLDFLREFRITTQPEMDVANQMLGHVKDAWKGMEEKRVSIVQPLNQAMRNANALFKPVLGAYKAGEEILKAKIAEATRAGREAQDAALAAVEAAGGNASAEVLAVAHGAGPTQPDNISIRTEWVFEVVSAVEVPREFCKPDEALLGAYVKVKGADAAIPGVRVFQREVVTKRA